MKTTETFGQLQIITELQIHEDSTLTTLQTIDTIAMEEVWKHKLSGYTLHSFYINQKYFFCSTCRKTTWILVLNIFRRFSLQNPSKWVRGLDAYSILLSITCPMIFSCRYLAKIEKHKHYIGHICLCGTKSENFPLLKRINIISIHIYNKIIV